VDEAGAQFVVPTSISSEYDMLQEVGRHMQRSVALYRSLREAGVKKEDARYILPQGCTTSLRMTGNFQMWIDSLGNRTAKHAQWEVRDVALEIKRLLAEHAPGIFGDRDA
jgi:thymidylate synthase (FAD)